jgi:hypothetical protein
MQTLNKSFKYSVNSNNVLIEKKYRTKTQFEYYLTIFIGNSDFESIMHYQTIFLTKKSALNCAINTIYFSPKPKIFKVL